MSPAPYAPHTSAEQVAAFDDLAGADRQAVVRHAAGCAACRAALVADAPWRQFALLAVDALPGAALERLSDRLDRALDLHAPATERRPGATRYAWASVAAAVLLAGVFSISLLQRPVPPAGEGGLLPPSFRVSRAEPPRSFEEAAPGIELLDSPSTAQVLDLSVGETQVVMIFDEELGI